MKTRAEWWLKANALASAMPAAKVATIALGLAIAEGETRCGDAVGWEGEHNWGATTARPLHADEHAALGDVHPTVSLVYPKGADGVVPPGCPVRDAEAAGRAALAAAVAAGTIPDPGPTVALHCDSSPTQGPYFVFFAAFPSDEAGAKYFASFFRSPAERDALAAGAPFAMASAMYNAGYYTGFHVRHGIYVQRNGRWVLLAPGETPDGPTTPGAVLNVEAYSATLERLLPVIRAALVGWTPGAEPEVYTEPAEPPSSSPPSPDRGSPAWVQAALNAAGAAPVLTVDGIIGPKTQAALRAFQKAHGLKASGTATPATVDALATYLDAATV